MKYSIYYEKKMFSYETLRL